MKLSAIVASALIAGSTIGLTGASAVAMSAAHMTELQQLEMQAHTAQAAIQASPQDYKAMQDAIAMRSANSSARPVRSGDGPSPGPPNHMKP